MATIRFGNHGAYYGSFYNENSEALTTDEMKINARYIYLYLINKGWSMNAICAILGNMQAESSINPGRWQNDTINTANGFGLVQWTPSTKFTLWCTEKGYSDPSEMDSNLARIIYEVENGIQWIATDSYSYSFQEFTKSSKTVSELAKAFLLNYERPANQDATVMAVRSAMAEGWYTYLTGDAPTPPTNPDDEEGSSKTNRKRKFNFLLFGVRKRRKTWTNQPF